MSEISGDIPWLRPIVLDPKVSLNNTESIVRALRRQLKTALQEQGFSQDDLDRCVYVIRMKGAFSISYPERISPVLYIGRGAAFGRVGQHLKNWLGEIDGLGKM